MVFESGNTKDVELYKIWLNCDSLILKAFDFYKKNKKKKNKMIRGF